MDNKKPSYYFRSMNDYLWIIFRYEVQQPLQRLETISLAHGMEGNSYFICNRSCKLSNIGRTSLLTKKVCIHLQNFVPHLPFREKGRGYIGPIEHGADCWPRRST